MIAAEEPLAHIAYVYDGTPEGLLTAVFQAYANHEDPEDIVQGAAFQPRLDQSVRTIETDAALAERVKRGLVRATGKAGFTPCCTHRYPTTRKRDPSSIGSFATP